jgi:hypothetical protein
MGGRYCVLRSGSNFANSYGGGGRYCVLRSGSNFANSYGGGGDVIVLVGSRPVIYITEQGVCKIHFMLHQTVRKVHNSSVLRGNNVFKEVSACSLVYSTQQHV